MVRAFKGARLQTGAVSISRAQLEKKNHLKKRYKKRTSRSGEVITRMIGDEKQAPPPPPVSKWRDQLR